MLLLKGKSRSVRLPFRISKQMAFLLEFCSEGRKRHSRMRGNESGFSLVEVVVILSIVGILTIAAVALLNNSNPKFQYETMMRKMASDVRFAQELALSSGTGTSVYIDQTNNRYYLQWNGGAYIQKPVGGEDFIVQLGSHEFADVQITATAFTNGKLDFSTSGVPLNSGAPFSGELNLVTLNNALSLRITANTGLLRIEEL